jgi:Aspartyl protease
LIDNGSHAVLIHDDFVNELTLHPHKIPEPETVELAMEGGGKKVTVELTKYVKLKVYDSSSWWCVKSVCAIITPGLCSPVLLGLPFLSQNHI